MKRVRDADGDGEAEQSLGQAERPEVAIPPEQCARNYAPHQRGSRENKVGKVRCGEEDTGEHHGGGFTRDEAQQPVHEIVLQKKLLINGPEHVAGDVREIGLVEGM